MVAKPNSRSEKSRYVDSYYAATLNETSIRQPLQGASEADVCVVGGGYTGLSTAIHLAEKGYKVIVLEAEVVGWGASGRNGGHVGVGQRKGQSDLEKQFGLTAAKTLWSFSVEAVDLVRSLIQRFDINCDLKHGILHLAAKESHNKHLLDETENLNDVYGYDRLRYVDPEEARAMVGTTRYFGGQLDSGSSHLHPLNYLRGLAMAAEKLGVVIHENSRVLSVGKDDPVITKSAAGSVSSTFAVLACNGYLDKLNGSLAGRIMPINNFVLATEPLSEDQARELIRDDVAVQDTLFVINYWKLSGDNRLLFGGGENYSRRFPADMKRFVRKFMLRVYPQLDKAAIDYAWGGTLAITLNRLPDFGRLSSNVFYAQGFSGHGVPTATFAGKLLAEAVAGTAERFDVMANLPIRRFPGGALLRWPGLVLGMLYYSLLDRL